MHPLLRHLAILSLALTTACSTVVEGRTQSITVSSEPTGAHCFIERAGDVVARVTTPGTATIEKSKNDIVVSCSKEGYETTSVKDRSEMAITSVGNAAFYYFSFLGSAVDSATGASNKYDSTVFVKLPLAGTPESFPMMPGTQPQAQFPPESVPGMSMQPPMPPAPATYQPVMPPPAPSPANGASALPPATVASNPSIHAAVSLAQAALQAAKQQQVVQLSYAQQVAQAAQRPPFEITQ